MARDHSHLPARLAATANRWHDRGDCWEELLHRMQQARIVCIGEASHGTHEFYRIRADLTRRLITDHGFTAVAVEADWPDAYRVNRFVQALGKIGAPHDASANDALRGFERFPAWMWRNVPVREFIDWLRRHNERLAPNEVRAGFYGMDLYSLYRSINAVIHYLDKVDPGAAKRARARYACFEQFQADPQHYGYATGIGLADPCEGEVISQLLELQRQAGDYARRDGSIPADEYFFAEQNARLVKNAEEYYRSMYRGRHSSWNLRDTHMVDTVDALLQHLLDRDGQAKLVLWAHNSHLGDARATQMGRRGELNLGQLVRQRYPRETFHLGFTTNDGTVLAASDWDMPSEVKRVRPGMEGSYERLFHEVSHKIGGDFVLHLRDGDAPRAALLEAGEMLERAIGVIYLPETERQSHYFYADIANQFDAVIHVDRTRALDALDPPEARVNREAPETYPSAV
ncbi:MAG TPA: erythromycin esterase family protein [Phycisphaerae bacterium]|nr:erythromycin esterase family protein [Phycisphaerae bacterium]